MPTDTVLNHSDTDIIEQLQNELNRQRERTDLLESMLYDLADEFQASSASNNQVPLPRLTEFRLRQSQLHSIITRAFGFPWEEVVSHRVSDQNQGKISGPLDIQLNRPRAARRILFFLLRIEFPDVATRSRIRRDYNTRIDTRELINGMAEILLIAEYKNIYRSICKQYAFMAELPSDWMPEPSYRMVRQVAVQKAAGSGGTGRPPLDDRD